jgi:hypothetical protein
MQPIIAPIVLLAWALVVVILFRVLGPRRASTIAVLGGFLILPRYAALLDFPTIERRTIPGLALLLGVLLFDRRSLVHARPRWIDLPMALFVLSPAARVGRPRGRDPPGGVRSELDPPLRVGRPLRHGPPLFPGPPTTRGGSWGRSSSRASPTSRSSPMRPSPARTATWPA